MCFSGKDISGNRRKKNIHYLQFSTRKGENKTILMKMKTKKENSQWHGLHSGYWSKIEENVVLLFIGGTKGLKTLICTFWEDFACTLRSGLSHCRQTVQNT